MVNSAKLYQLLLPCPENKFSPHLSRKKHWLKLAVFLLALKLLTVGLFWSLPEQAYLSEISSSKVIELTNKERTTLGLSTLTSNALLTQAAYAKAQDMLSLDYWSHVSPDGKEPWDFIRASGYEWSVAGENLAKGFRSSEAVLAAWMASVKHKENILKAAYTEIGVAVVTGKLQGRQTILVVQMLGAPLKQSSLDQNLELPQALQTQRSGTITKPPRTEASPSSGTFYDTVVVKLVSDDLANKIYYTLNGQDPTTNSSLYTRPLLITASQELKFMAVSTAGLREEVQNEKYLIRKSKNKKPIITSPADGALLARAQVIIRGQAFQAGVVTLNLNEKPSASVETLDDADHSFSFREELADGAYFARVDISGRNSESSRFSIDTLAPQIDLGKLMVKAEQEGNKVNYTIKVPVSGEPQFVKLFCDAQEKLFNKAGSEIFLTSLTEAFQQTGINCTIYTEDLARNTSTASFVLNGQLGETLGVSDPNSNSAAVHLSNSFDQGFRYLSLGLSFLLCCSLALRAYAAHLRQARSESYHASLHALLVGLLFIVLLLI